jgi:hypothetical protein
MFVKRTFDGSDISNLTKFDTIDEAGIEFDTSPASIAMSSLSTNCSAPTVLMSLNLSVPDTVSSNYVVCRAAGRSFHSQVNVWNFVSIDETTGGTTDTWRYTGTDSTAFPSSYSNWAMQHAYTVGSEGGSQTYYLRACRQNNTVTGTIFLDHFTCEYFPTRY